MYLWHVLHISIHAPTRGATNQSCVCSKKSCISIHAPTRGATVQRGGEWLQVVISIHAPTRGATITNYIKLRFHVFQSTLPREERLLSLCQCHSRMNFNPRSHERSDVKYSLACSAFSISIHAPTRGATTDSNAEGQFLHFNPRSHERSDYQEA